MTSINKSPLTVCAHYVNCLINTQLLSSLIHVCYLYSCDIGIYSPFPSACC